jgi:ABC-type phosphate transport system substrate-binding protein
MALSMGWIDHPAYASDAGSVIVIVNSTNKIESLSAREISLLFLKNVKKWEDGRKVLPVDQVEDSSIRDKFSNEILGRKVSAVEAFWQKQIFTGRGVPPPEKNSDKDVMAYVQENEGAIGYISAATDIRSLKVKVLKIEN